MSNEKKVLSKKADLKIFSDIIDSIEEYRQQSTLKSLVQIGTLLHSISWNEDDGNCIRNKQGFRNRARGENNKVNSEGAAIDFEAMGHLRRLAADTAATPVLQQHAMQIVSSLNQLKHKIEYVISYERPFIHEHSPNLFSQSQTVMALSEEYKADCGFLWYYCAYSHDRYCVDSILRYLEEFSKIQGQDLSLATNRYHLSYIFCQIGELAKEVSDFVKPERNPSVPEQNLSRFFFTRLGHYRQRIKNKPYIVHTGSFFAIAQMRTALSMALPELRIVLEDLQARLVQFDIRNFKNYNSILEFSDRLPTDSFLNIHSKRLQSLSNLLRLGTKKNLRGIPEKIKSSIATLEEGRRVLEGQLKEAAELSQAERSKIQKVSHTKNSKQLLFLLSSDICQEFYSQCFSDVKVFCDRQLREQNKPVSPEENAAAKKLNRVYDLFDNSKALIGKLSNQKVNLESLRLSELHEMLKLIGENTAAADVVSKLQQKIKTKEKMALSEEELLSEVEKFIVHVEAGCKAGKTVYSIIKSEVESAIENLVDVLMFLGSCTDELTQPQDLNYGILMAIGLIGQYSRTLFELTKNSVIRDHINVLLEECMKKSDYLRSKMILHDAVNQDLGIINATLVELILPIRADFEALRIVIDSAEEDTIRLVKAFKRLGLEGEALRLLYDHLEMIERKNEGSFASFGELIGVLTVHNVHPDHVALLQSLDRVLPLKDQNTQIRESSYQNDKLIILLLMLDCYTRQQDFPRALDVCAKLLALLSNILGKLKRGKILAETLLSQEILNSIEDIYLFAIAQQSYFYLNLGDTALAARSMATIAKMFGDDNEFARKHSSMLARFYTDLCHASYNNPFLAERYMSMVESVLAFCPDKLIIEYNIHFRRYELAISNTRSLPVAGKNFVNYFYKHEAAFKKEYGMHYLAYKMEVLLAEYNLDCMVNNCRKAQDIMEKLDKIQVSVIDLVINNKYYISKLLLLSSKRNINGFSEVLEQFFTMNSKANNLRKFVSLSLKVVEDVRGIDLKSAAYCGSFLKKNCATFLTEGELSLLTAVLNVASADSSRFHGAKGSKAPKRNDPCHCGSGEKFKKCHSVFN